MIKVYFKTVDGTDVGYWSMLTPVLPTVGDLVLLKGENANQTRWRVIDREMSVHQGTMVTCYVAAEERPFRTKSEVIDAFAANVEAVRRREEARQKTPKNLYDLLAVPEELPSVPVLVSEVVSRNTQD